MNRTLRRLAVTSLATIAIAAAPAPAPRKANWSAMVTLTPGGGHMLGNPAAQLKLTEYVSYTCPHCSDFEIQSDTPLRLAYVPSGKLSVEVRHLVRDPVDLTAALLANCGAKEKFFGNHAALMRSQKTWFAIYSKPGKAQQTRWTSGTMPARSMAIASDLGFYRIMATRGYDRPTLDRCLSDVTMAQRLAEQTEQAHKLDIHGTPSFAINGMVLIATHDWATLRPQLEARL